MYWILFDYNYDVYKVAEYDLQPEAIENYWCRTIIEKNWYGVSNLNMVAWKIDDNNWLTKKTMQDKVDDGDIVLEPNQKIVDDAIVTITDPDELYSLSLLTEMEWNDLKISKYKMLRYTIFRANSFILNLNYGEEKGVELGKILEADKKISPILFGQWLDWFNEMYTKVSTHNWSSTNYADVEETNEELFPTPPNLPESIL